MIRKFVIFGSLFMLCTLPANAQMDVGREQYIIDSERARFLTKERELARTYDDLQRAQDDLKRAQIEIDKKQVELTDAMKRVKHELNTVKLKLL